MEGTDSEVEKSNRLSYRLNISITIFLVPASAPKAILSVG